MFITIIIPLYNSNYIDIQIKSIYSLVLKNIGFEIIYVDDWSSESYKKIYIEKFNFFLDKNISFKYLDLWDKKWKNRVCLARNIWVKNAKYDNLLFIDQETILHKNYFQELLLMKWDIILWQSLWYNNEIKTLNIGDINYFIKNWKINKKWFFDFRLNFDDIEKKWKILWASNLYIKKEIFNKIWWFDEKINLWWDEDVEFWYRLYKKGYKINFNKELKVLNLSEKLYNLQFSIIEESKIDNLTNNFLYNYNKHWKNREYKDYILERFIDFNYKQKLLSNIFFKREILCNNFYEKKRNHLVFFRLDDVNELSEKFKKIIKIFIKYNIPITLAIEPWNISNEMVAFIKVMKARFPFIIEIAQHWYRHINYNNKWFKYEFWIKRTFDEQCHDISEWKEIMSNLFWKFVSKVFIPPFNNINIYTERVLEKLWFDILSSWYPYWKYLWKKNIISVPAYVDIIKEYESITYKSEEELYKEINYYLFRDWYAGIIIHDQFFNEEIFRLLIKILEYLKVKKLDFLTFTEFSKIYKSNEI